MHATPAWCALPESASNRFIIERWTTADGLPQNSVNDIRQNQAGHLWLATNGGLARFDGTAFDVVDMSPRPGVDSARFLSVHADPLGTLWLGTHRRGVLTLSPDGLLQSHALAGKAVRDFAATDNTLWAATNAGVVRLKGHQADVVLAGSVQAVLAAPDGTIWSTTTDGPTCISGAGCADGPADGGTPGVPAFALAVDGRGTLWSLGQQGLSHRAPNGEWTLEVALKPQGVGALLYEEANDRLWFSSGLDLLVRERDGRVSRVPLTSELRPDEVPRYPVRSLELDRAGSIWVGVDGGGLFQVRDRRVIRHGLGELTDPSVRTVLADQALDRLWIGSGCERLSWLQNNQLESLELPGPSAGCVRALALDTDGALWFGAGSRLYHLDGDDLTWLDAAHGLPDQDVLSLLPRGDGSLLVGTTAGVFAVADGKATPAYPGAGLVNARVPVMIEADGGAHWLGTDNGIVNVGGPEVVRLSATDGLSPGAVRDLHLDQDGTLWVGTYGGGLTRLRDGKIERFTRSRGLCDDVVSRILDGGDGALWMNGNRGLFRVERQSLEAVASGSDELLACVLLESGEGNGGASPAGTRSADGHLWFPTIAGVAEVDPETADLSVVAPLVSVARATIDGRPLEASRGDDRPFHAPPGPGRLTVELTGLDFTAPGGVVFRHRLVGHDTAWHESTSRRIEYAALPPGTYRFEAYARGARGGVSDIHTLSFTKAPYLWQRTWYWVVVGALLLVGVSVGWWVRLRQVARRTAALQAEVLLRRQLGEQLRQAERAETLGHLAGSAVHDFNNVLMGVAAFAQLLHDDLGGRPEAGLVQHIQRAADRGRTLASRVLAVGSAPQAELEELFLGDVVDELIPVMRGSCGPSIEVVHRRQDDCPQVRVGRSDLENALLNLASNATDAMPQGGELTIETGAVVLGRLEATTRGVPDGAWAVLTVADSGTGMSPEVRERVFEPFYTTKGEATGTGLGLLTVQRVARGAGGFVTVASEPGEGTTFQLWFPAVD